MQKEYPQHTEYNQIEISAVDNNDVMMRQDKCNLVAPLTEI